MLSRIRRLIRGWDDRLVPALLGIVLVAAIIWALSRGAEDAATSPQIVQLTIDSASTQANLRVPTLAAGLTQTPPDAALTGAAPTLALGGRQEIRQYAATATADSQISDLDWAAIQAAGPPNTDQCGDFRTAWAPAQPDTVASLTLYYPQLVRPTGLRVIQTYNPGFITRISITDLFGEVHDVYAQPAQAVAACPFALEVRIPEADYAGNVVVIYVDQTTSVQGRIQIDAVELIGIKY